MKKSLRFLHAADLHIDSPFKGMANVPKNIFQQIVSSTFSAFDKIIEEAIRLKVDFVILVGDIFDEEARSLKAQLKIRNGLEKLRNHQIDVFISYGNHDHLGGKFFDVDYPDNVHVFTSEKVTNFPYYKNGQHVANIYGFSYEARAVTDEKVKEFIISNEDVYHIGMLHGSLAMNQDHDVYAPFRISDLKSQKIDYWALGHIHKREVILEEPYAVYPGNIQGRHIKELGEKGCYLVEFTDDQCHLTFIPTHQIRFEQAQIDVTFCQSIDELEARIKQEKELLRNQYGNSILRLQLEIDATKFPDVTQEHLVELQEIMNEAEQDERTWVWIDQLKASLVYSWNKDELKKGKHFTGELLRVIENSHNISDYIKEITSHREISKIVDPITNEELDEIVEDAERLLIEELMRE